MTRIQLYAIFTTACLAITLSFIHFHIVNEIEFSKTASTFTRNDIDLSFLTDKPETDASTIVKQRTIYDVVLTTVNEAYKSNIYLSPSDINTALLFIVMSLMSYPIFMTTAKATKLAMNKTTELSRKSACIHRIRLFIKTLTITQVLLITVICIQIYIAFSLSLIHDRLEDVESITFQTHDLSESALEASQSASEQAKEAAQAAQDALTEIQNLQFRLRY